MPSVLTRDFGLLDTDTSAELHFPLGLPGFASEKSFVVIEQTASAPLVFLQSTTTSSLCFLAIPVLQIDPDYQIGMSLEDLRAIGCIETENACQPVLGSEVLCLTILSAHDDGTLTANLLAPIVVNLQTRLSVQAVRLDSRYSHQTALTQGEPAKC